MSDDWKDDSWQGSEADEGLGTPPPSVSSESNDLADGSFDFDEDLGPPKEKSVTWKGNRYVLREASEGAAALHRGIYMRATRFSAEGKPGAVDSSAADADPMLVAQCLFKVGVKDGKEIVSKTPCDLRFVKDEFPARLIKRMLAWVKKYSEIDIEEESEEILEKKIKELQGKLDKRRARKGEAALKNEPEGTPVTSDLPTI